jgi:haloalkane dehalogenase
MMGNFCKTLFVYIIISVFSVNLTYSQEIGSDKNPMTNQPNISAEFHFESKYLEIKGSRMHYIDEGEGTPFLFLHGNPTSSYLWRNIIPHVMPHGRVIAVDLIGMGKSDKPDIDYRFLTHAAYIDAFIEKLGLDNIVLVIHDWGSVLGFHYAFRHQENVKGIAFMEAILRPAKWKEFPFLMKIVFKRFRNKKKGKKMIMEKNFFVEKLMKMAIIRKLSKEEMDNYRAPYPDYDSRFPLYVWPNEIPIDGFPKNNHQAISDYSKWLQETEIPKLLLWVKPGAIIPYKQVPTIEGLMKNLTTVFVGKGKHYVQEDQPDAIGEAIVKWYKGI